MTEPRHLRPGSDTPRPTPFSGPPHAGAADRQTYGAPAPASDGVPAGSASATEPRRGRLFSTLVAGAIAGAAVAAPLTLVLDDHDASHSTAEETPPRAAATPVTAPTVGGVDVASVLDVARPAVVAIRTEMVTSTARGVQRGEAAGSGFVIDPDGTIVTNSHVVDGARSISVAFADGSELAAQLIAQDASRDLAVLSVEGNGELTALEIGDSSELGVGDPVVAIGNALGMGGDLTVTTGIVSAKDRDVPVPPNITLRDMIQTDAAINPGNSGGPLVDAAGRVVGINSAGATGAQSIGFAIPIDAAMPVIESLARGEVLARPFLGVQTVDLTEQVRSQAGIEREDGALVVDVTAGSAAENAGIRVGDVITGLAGHDVEHSSDLGDAVSDLEPDQSTDIEVDRGGDERTLPITVGARPGSVT